MDAITYDLDQAVQIVDTESEVVLYPAFLDATTAGDLAASLTDHLGWQRLTGIMFGRQFAVPRDTCWVGPVAYKYGSIRHDPAEWPATLLPRRLALEEALAVPSFATVLANRYRDGRDKVDWHADDEQIFGPAPVIASVSLGATRKFKLRHNVTREVHEMHLTAGSLLVMRGATQLEFQHCIPAQKAVANERINLTFRTLSSRA